MMARSTIKTAAREEREYSDARTETLKGLLLALAYNIVLCCQVNCPNVCKLSRIGYRCPQATRYILTDCKLFLYCFAGVLRNDPERQKMRITGSTFALLNCRNDRPKTL